MFYDVFVNLCNKVGKSPSAVAVEIGFQKSVVTRWKKNNVTPTDANLAKIASYFGVTVDFLLTGEQKENPTAKSDEVTFDDFTYALHNQSKELNDANKEKLLDMARMLKLAQDAQKNK